MARKAKDAPASVPASAIADVPEPVEKPVEKKPRRGELPEAVIRPAACPRCRSTKRAPFRDGPLSESAVPVELDGQPFNRQAWYNTECKDCGQRYRVIKYGYVPPEPAAEEHAG